MSIHIETFISEIKNIKKQYGITYFKKNGLNAVLLDLANDTDRRFINILKKADELSLPQNLSGTIDVERPLQNIYIANLRRNFTVESGLDTLLANVVFDAFLYGLDLKELYNPSDYLGLQSTGMDSKVDVIQEKTATINSGSTIKKTNTGVKRTSGKTTKSKIKSSPQKRINKFLWAALSFPFFILKKLIPFLISPFLFLLIIFIFNYFVNISINYKFFITPLIWFIYFNHFSEKIWFALGISDRYTRQEYGIGYSLDEPYSSISDIFFMIPFFIIRRWFEQIPILYLSFKIWQLSPTF